jgi:lipoprotein-anchoring transpeptidase ErfK/SrfK
VRRRGVGLASALAAVLAGALAVSAPVAVRAQGSEPRDPGLSIPARHTEATAGIAATPVRPTVPAEAMGTLERTARFKSRRDSLAYESARTRAARAGGFRVVISLEDRELAVLDGIDTLLVAPVAIGMDTTITYRNKRWTFVTPRGRRTVLAKQKDPVWIPPDWHYAEVAARRGLELAQLSAKRPVRLADGRTLTVRGGRAGLVLQDGTFAELPVDEEIIFADTLYMPPLGSENRRIPGELGRFRLDMGNGYLLHGTPYEDTVGQNATHGCIRLYDEDIQWLFEKVPVGTAVYIY